MLVSITALKSSNWSVRSIRRARCRDRPPARRYIRLRRERLTWPCRLFFSRITSTVTIEIGSRSRCAASRSAAPSGVRSVADDAARSRDCERGCEPNASARSSDQNLRHRKLPALRALQAPRPANAAEQDAEKKRTVTPFNCADEASRRMIVSQPLNASAGNAPSGRSAGDVSQSLKAWGDGTIAPAAS